MSPEILEIKEDIEYFRENIKSLNKQIESLKKHFKSFQGSFSNEIANIKQGIATDHLRKKVTRLEKETERHLDLINNIINSKDIDLNSLQELKKIIEDFNLMQNNFSDIEKGFANLDSKQSETNKQLQAIKKNQEDWAKCNLNVEIVIGNITEAIKVEKDARLEREKERKLEKKARKKAIIKFLGWGIPIFIGIVYSSLECGIKRMDKRELAKEKIESAYKNSQTNKLKKLDGKIEVLNNTITTFKDNQNQKQEQLIKKINKNQQLIYEKLLLILDKK